MSSEKKDFFGKTIADAIKQACDTFQIPQEELNIEVVEAGSTGIFGFIRKKAHIRASCKPIQAEPVTEKKNAGKKKAVEPPAPPQKAEPAPQTENPQPVPASPIPKTESSLIEDEEESTPDTAPEEPLSEESIQYVREELGRLLELMGLPSQVEIEAQGSSVRCHIIGEYQEDLCGQEGKTLDSLQYLLRKIATRKISERIRIAIDVGNYREKRQDELQEMAIQLATQVKEDGKTQIIASLNPSERRIVHMALQEDKDIRSRSVGDGLFKKVLIYKPGSKPSSGGTGKKRPQSRGRRGKSSKQQAPPDNNETGSSGENE